MGVDPYVGCNFDIAKDDCTLETCCLAQSYFLYRPDYSGNLFYVIFFLAFIFPQVGLGIKYKTWGYMVGLFLGLVLEAIGYCSRIGLHQNPFSQGSFMLYLVGLTIAPVFITAGIYLCLSRLIILYGEDLSILPPRTLAVSFMTSDFLTLVMQGVGGVWAQTAHQKGENARPGLNLMIAGLLLQAISLGFFVVIGALFMLRVRRGMPDQSPSKVFTRRRPLFKAFLGGLLLSTILILIRSIYRVAELWGGFKGKLWNDEADFMVLDGCMMGISVILLTAFHPGPASGAQWSASNWSLRGDIDPKIELSSNPDMPLGPERQMVSRWKHKSRL
ncbi:hypothetical protein M409DRAFT_27887 [Zasmidium cellare ATCC 36951]|uniref:RTA1 domain protein n=1 Tax=Zasmidium cellare ATCC 36951 TaxID=1080233 RepID=A0A6A6C483_ZASCE|nr:uncharacterized protein M409DRAFT_27887 [Zasmidium cellare ATCC 36951]KAF2161831.1 hypothetical protein M409DRAFT_27887 [Zasmidium cellare ATCC 36951]